jgi:ATP-dependent exoDNAse (exonuclease V) beta subunit
MKKATPKPPLADEEHRHRFTHEHGKNISVIAPAGVGKTRGIVERILQIARDPRAHELLPRLVVVTFSVAAAQEMQGRARIGIREEKVPARIQRAFQQAFFGTIHSFCVRLLSRFGHYLGLPGALTLPRSEDELWERFLIHGARHDPLSDPALRDLFQFYTVEQLYGLGRTVAPAQESALEPMPMPDARRLLAYQTGALHASTRKAVIARQDALAAWDKSWVRGDRFQPLPSCGELKAPEFVALWRETFAPLNDWLRRGALEFGRRVANDFADFRLYEGVMTYDDQVRLALRLLETPAVRDELRRERWSVLLDEAQDTDRNQFEVLTRVAGLRPELDQAADQTFCIVGDFQQAIWAPRSDLAVYLAVHEEMLAGPTGLAAQLQVTFRCDRAIIEFVNQLFEPLLDAAEGQARFVPLRARDEAGEGQVVRWTCPSAPISAKKMSAGEGAFHEARFLAAEIARLQPEGLGADRWQDVAILCPRRDWLHVIQRALARADVPAQLHSGDEAQGGSTPRAWLTALVWIAAHPEDRFEIAGVLRDVLGVPDDAMALFTDGDGDLLRLDRPAKGDTGVVADALALLRRACEGVAALPLHLAARQLIERTRLRDRLISLKEEHPDLIDGELDELLSLIDQRGGEGATLARLARDLREALGQVSPSGEEVRDAVQLYTWHKSKGLEWQTVIVPFVFRTFGEKSLSYPRLVLDRKGEETIYRESDDYAQGAKEFVERRAWQQFQRLLYVTCTRPRHTLLFINDETLFAEARKIGPYCAAKLLEIDEGPARELWQSLPATLQPKPDAAKTPPPAPELIPPYPPLSRADFSAAIASGQRIPRRVTPHALAVHPPPEAEPERIAERDEPIADSPAILYGTWWHELMEIIPWQEPRAAWAKHFDKALASSPQPDRSRREWEILRESELARWLATPGLVIHRELPFIWPDDERCLEGVMDLAVYSPVESRWRVIDWKTNRTDGEGLRAIYRGQIEAYVEALRALLDAPVEGSLYLTATGEWLALDARVSAGPTT